MTDGLNAVLSKNCAAPTDTNHKNLELASPQFALAIRIDQVVYSRNCYIQIFRHNVFPQWGSNPQPVEFKVQCSTDYAIELYMPVTVQVTCFELNLVGLIEYT